MQLKTICGIPKKSLSSITVTLTSRCDSYFECSGISFHESKVHVVDMNFKDLDYDVRQSRGIEI